MKYRFIVNNKVLKESNTKETIKRFVNRYWDLNPLTSAFENRCGEIQELQEDGWKKIRLFRGTPKHKTNLFKEQEDVSLVGVQFYEDNPLVKEDMRKNEKSN